MPGKHYGFKMYGKSPMMKKLIGKQHNLPEHLKEKIEAAPGKMLGDLDKDGKMSSYESKRQAAIEKNKK